ncbi:MAG: CHAD domain-containing protein [Verrucomicrobiae bacterium]|nr:CHAD domain-containing protein [Verrucomicrobiae bacterium]
MPRRRAPTIERLCAACANENAHTEHVTALALRLFDETRAWLGLRAADRRLLKAAGRLHDIGYAADPENHADLSAQIVLRDGVKGFSEPQRRRIAAIIALHARKLKSWSDHPRVAALPDPRRALRLGALLRIADGLDYSHLQDASIARVRRRGNRVVVRIASGASPVNLARADEKADLWRAVMPFNIRFVTRAGPLRRSAPPLRAGDHPLEAARRLLMFQYRTLLANVEGAIEGRGPEPLHDIRVAVRRMRSALRVFRPLLPGASAARIDDALRTLNRSLGPARDVDVWIEFLTSDAVSDAMSAEPGWRLFLNRQLALQERQRAVVRRLLQGRRFAALRTKLGRLLRIELAQLARAASPAGLRPLAARAMAKSLRRIEKRQRLRHSTQPDDLHQLRIALRRARYVGEFFGGVLGRPIAKLTRLIHRTERVLAEIHDIDAGLDQFRHRGPAPPRRLVDQLMRLRRKHLRALKPAWKRFAKARHGRKVESRLKTQLGSRARGRVA